MSVWVTVSILAGPEDCPTNVPTVRCESAPAAIEAIHDGKAAWIPLDPWDQVVFDTIVGLGNSPACARREIHMARTGVLLPEEAFVVSEAERKAGW